MADVRGAVRGTWEGNWQGNREGKLGMRAVQGIAICAKPPKASLTATRTRFPTQVIPRLHSPLIIDDALTPGPVYAGRGPLL